METVEWQEFIAFMERLIENLKSFTVSDTVKQGLPLSTTIKMRGLKIPEDLTELRTKTIFQTAKIVDGLNLELNQTKTSYAHEFKKFMNGVIRKFVGRKTFSELRDMAVVPTPMVSKLRKERGSGNYYLGTIAKIVEYLEENEQVTRSTDQDRRGFTE